MPTAREPDRVPTVLVVDDEPTVRKLMSLVLEEEGFHVLTAATAAEGLAKFRQHEPDVIVLDISMPGMSGLEVASRLRQAGCTAAVVFLTVHDEEDIIFAARAAGAMGYVVKPRLGSDLTLAVQEAHAGRPFVSPVQSTD